MFVASQSPMPVAIGTLAVVGVTGAVAGALRVVVERRERRATQAPPWHFASYHLPGRTA